MASAAQEHSIPAQQAEVGTSGVQQDEGPSKFSSRPELIVNEKNKGIQRTKLISLN